MRDVDMGSGMARVSSSELNLFGSCSHTPLCSRFQCLICHRTLQSRLTWHSTGTVERDLDKQKRWWEVQRETMRAADRTPLRNERTEEIELLAGCDQCRHGHRAEKERSDRHGSFQALNRLSCGRFLSCRYLLLLAACPNRRDERLLYPFS
ncbi:hypothetical protein LY78DRAFT_185527 [Colletotrichum sublineola]|nr:hypothetical protein LY78DRAFT_185527 [Colletotrichum sublineola]